jgi:hypothetical protein
LSEKGVILSCTYGTVERLSSSDSLRVSPGK